MKNEEKQFDRLLQAALEDQVEQRTSLLKTEQELISEGIEPHTFSKDFEKNIKKRIKLKKNTIKKTKFFHRAVAAILLLCGVSTIAIASVDAIRVPIFSFVLNLGKDNSEIDIQNSDNSFVSQNYKEYYPSYLPKEFVITSFTEYDSGYNLSMATEDERLLQLDFYTELAGFNIDTENMDIEEREIQGFPALVSYRENRLILFWMPENKIYSLIGNVSIETGIEILESISFFS